MNIIGTATNGNLIITMSQEQFNKVWIHGEKHRLDEIMSRRISWSTTDAHKLLQEYKPITVTKNLIGNSIEAAYTSELIDGSVESLHEFASGRISLRNWGPVRQAELRAFLARLPHRGSHPG